jgi:hypothetical protein
MKYKFITTSDIEAAIKDIYLAQISPDESHIKIAENAAIERIKAVLNQRYLVQDIFPVINEWAIETSYSVPEPINGVDFFNNNVTFTPTFKRVGLSEVVSNYVYYDGKFYKALTDIDGTGTVIADNPADNPLLWAEEDPRNALIVQYVVNIMIFNICVRIAPRKIPEHRKFMYDEAVAWIKEVRDNLITPDLPKQRPIDDSADSIPFGSEGKVEGGWHY